MTEAIEKRLKNAIFLKFLKNLAVAAKQLEKMKPFRGKFRKKREVLFFLTNLLTKIKKSCNRTMIILFLFTLNF